VGPRAGLDRCGKSRPPPGFDPRTVKPVASRCTDYATRSTIDIYLTKKVKVKVNCTLVQALRLCTGRTAHWVRRGIALLFDDHDTIKG